MHDPKEPPHGSLARFMKSSSRQAHVNPNSHVFIKHYPFLLVYASLVSKSLLLIITINRETLKELEDLETLLNTLDNLILSTGVDTSLLLLDTDALESLLGAADSGNGLTPAVAVDEDLAGTASGEERVHGALAAEDALSTLSNNNGIEAGGVSGRVGLVDTVGKELGDDGDLEAVLLKLLLEGLGLVEGVALRGGEDTDAEGGDGGERLVEDGDAAGDVVVVVGGVGLGSLKTKSDGDALGDVVGDLVELLENVLLDLLVGDMAGLEADGVDDELLLNGGERVEEETGLGVVVVEGGAELAVQETRGGAAGGGEEALADGLVGLSRVALVEVRGSVVVDVLVDPGLALTVAVVVVDGRDGTVDGELLEVGTLVTVELGIEIAVETTLQQGILCEVDTTDNVAGLEGDLLGLGEVVGRVAVEGHLTENLEGSELLGKELGRIKEVEAIGLGLLLIDELNGELPRGGIARLNGLPEISTVEIGVLASEDLSLLPDESGLALLGLPVPLDELGLAVLGHQTEGVHTETIHVTVAAGNAVARHGPEEGVESGGLRAEEVPSRIVGGGSLGNLVVGARLDGVDKVGEADGILDEEDGDVVANDIEVALIGIAGLS